MYVSFYNTTASVWTLATLRSTLESIHKLDLNQLRFARICPKLCFCFRIKKYMFFGYFDPENISIDNENR